LKATAVAYPIQGLIKYHGLKDRKRRIPYHDSISVCIRALTTTTTVETIDQPKKDKIVVNDKELAGNDRKRVETVLEELKKIGEFSGSFKVVSVNSLMVGKGLGFSASGFAALGSAAAKSLNLDPDPVFLSKVVRRGAGSSTRSLAGSFAIWYADQDGQSYAKQLSVSENMDFSMVIVPVHSAVKTDEAHAEVLSSPLFKERCRYVSKMLEMMKLAIQKGETDVIGRLAEEDTLNLHAITMTGATHMVLWEPDTVRVIKEVIRMRNDGIAAWYSMDTGPSVFINTYMRNSKIIAKRLRKIGFKNVILSGVGGKPVLITNHLF
jgi:phosphomevalonate decarboxylase